MIYKIANTAEEYEQIFKLNYETFVEEIPQHEKNETKNRPPSVEEKPAFRPDGEPKELPILDIKTEPEARPTPQQKQPDPAKQPENQPEDDGDAIDSLF